MPANLISQLAQKITESPAFRSRFAELQVTTAKRRLSLDVPPIDEEKIGQLLLQGSVLAFSEDVVHCAVSQKINAMLQETEPENELISYAIQVLSSRLGNFPVISSDSIVFGANNIMRRLDEGADSVDTLDPEIVATLYHEEEASRSVLNGKVYHFNSYQKEILDALRTKSLVSFSAPTSFGKSFIVRHHIANLFASGILNRALIIVPTKSLIDDFYEGILELRRSLNLDFSIHTHARLVTNVPTKCIFILTQERLTFLMEKNPDLVRSFQTIYCDEAHYISRGYRGFVLRSAIRKLVDLCGPRGVNGNTQYIFSSPLIKNPDYYKETFFPALDNSQSFHKEVIYSPVEKNVHLVSKGSNTFAFSLLRDSLNGETFTQRLEEVGTRPFPIHLQGENRDDLKAKEISRDIHIVLESNLGARTILYTTSPLKAHQYAIELASKLPNKGTLAPQELQDLRKYIADHYDESFGLVELIQKGVGLHYGKMPIGLRRQIVNLFETGNLDYLICTSTLLEGVNLPAKNIFLFSNKHDGKHSHTTLSFWNLLGRAGRITYGLSGNIICVADKPEKYQTLLEKKETEIKDPEVEVTENQTKRKHVISSFLNETDQFYYVRSQDYRSDVEYLIYELLTADDMEGIIERFHLADEEKTGLLQAIRDSRNNQILPVDFLRKNPGIDPRLEDILFQSLRSLSLFDLTALLAITSNPLAVNKESLNQILYRTSDSLRWPLHNAKFDVVDSTSARITMWLHELPVSQFVEQALRYHPDIPELERVERALRTVDFLDKEISYSAPKYIKCFFDLVIRATVEKGMREISSYEESVELFLFAIESGVSSIIGRFLFELGVARPIAIRANKLVEELAGGQVNREFFDKPQVVTRLREGLSRIAFKELMDHMER